LLAGHWILYLFGISLGPVITQSGNQRVLTVK